MLRGGGGGEVSEGLGKMKNVQLISLNDLEIWRVEERYKDVRYLIKCTRVMFILWICVNYIDLW